MKSKAIVAVVIILLLIAGGAFYFLKVRGGAGGKLSSGANSLKSLIAAGIPQKCTFSSSDASGSSQGTTFVAGGKVRADITSVVSEQTTVSHMISDGKTNYIWSDNDKNGIKMTVPESSVTSAPSTGNTSGTGPSSEGDLNQTENYKCSAWLPDNSQFTPPSNITFSDFGSLMPSAAPAVAPSTSGSSSQCAYCETLTGDSKTQCLAALKCK